MGGLWKECVENTEEAHGVNGGQVGGKVGGKRIAKEENAMGNGGEREEGCFLSLFLSLS